MIKRLLAKLGYYPASALERAHYEGRIHGQEEVMEMYASRLESVRSQYSGIQRERDHFLKLLTERAAPLPPPPIIIRKEADNGEKR